MILFKSFSNAQEFQQIFGLRECGNGNKSRMNKILLGCLKDKQFVRYCAHNGDKSLRKLFLLDNMADFKIWLLQHLSKSSCEMQGYYCEFPVSGSNWQFYVPDLEVDNGGVCMDGDYRAVRYINHANNDRVFKMKAGKFFTKIMDACEFGQHLPQQAKSWLGEEFLTSWQSYAMRHAPAKTYEFHYGNEEEDFETIYSSDNRRGDFHSCMTDEDYYSMYKYSVKAHAAWLTDENGEMYARCIVWDDVLDETTGKHLRLAERQYSDGVQDCLKKQLVDELISRNLIDGYKQIGASCHDNRAYVLNDGTSISNHRLSIDCWLEENDNVSYMDSFVNYDIRYSRAYNYDRGYPCADLATTNGYLSEEGLHPDSHWSEYNDEWIPDDDARYDNSREDWFWESQCVECSNGDYHFKEGCICCDECGEYVLKNDSYRSDITECDYCSESCKEEAEERWYENNGYVKCDEDDCWYEESEVVTVKQLQHYYYGNHWADYTVTKEYFDSEREDGCMCELEGLWYWLDSNAAEEAFKNMTLPAVIVAA